MQKQKYNSDIELMEFEGWLFSLFQFQISDTL